MGAENPGRPNDFSDTPEGQTVSFALDHNLYWNGDQAIPFDGSELVNYTDDGHRTVDDPLLPELAGIILPRWQVNNHQFADGSTSIRQAFEKLSKRYGALSRQSPAVDAADPQNASSEDILGRPRPSGTSPDIGAFEFCSSNIPPGLFLIFSDF